MIIFMCYDITICLCVYFRFLDGDLSLGLEVALVADEEYYNAAVGMLPQLLQPPVNILKRAVLSNIVHQQRTHRITVISIGDSSITFLSCRVPYLRPHI